MNIEYKNLAIAELNNRTLESTIDCFEYLGINNKFNVKDISNIYGLDDTIYTAVSFPVIANKVYIVVYIDNLKGEVDEVIVSAGSIVNLTATTKKYTLEQLIDIVGLPPNAGWSMGDMKGMRTMNFSHYEISNSDNRSEDPISKLDKLLCHLEENKEVVSKLVEFSERCLLKIVIWNYYKQVDGLHLDELIIKRIASLKLSLDIESYLAK